MKKQVVYVSKKEKPVFFNFVRSNKDLIIVVKGPLGSVAKSLSRMIFFSSATPSLGALNLFYYNNSDFSLFLSKLRNMINGVFYGFYVDMFYKGLGYRAWAHDNYFYSNIGYTHIVSYKLPSDVIVKARKNHFLIFGSDIEKVNNVAAGIVKFRLPDPYRGKGVRFVDTDFVLKPGKQR